MAFRTIEISNPAEIHVQQHQMVIIQDAGTVSIPLDDILHITCSGPNIRISTLALSKLNEHGITLMTVDERYHASSITVPIKGHSRQSMVIHKQIELMDSSTARELWQKVIRRKIEGQRDVLRIMEIDDFSDLDEILSRLSLHHVDECEAAAAKRYFQLLSPGLNRRDETPLNSKLNYGYAVVRNAIIRSLINKGFQPAIGIHHTNQLNAFNLADDFIEPFRPMVDLMAISLTDESLILSKKERTTLAKVLHMYCEIGGRKEKVIYAIDHMTDSLKTCLFAAEMTADGLVLPSLLPIEVSDRVEE